MVNFVHIEIVDNQYLFEDHSTFRQHNLVCFGFKIPSLRRSMGHSSPELMAEQVYAQCVSGVT
jgi:hypothetical protein